jgi:hypothetical protein
MGQLVGEQFATAGTPWVVGALAKENVSPGGEGAGIEGAVQGIGMGIGMHADPAEISSKRRFHLAAHPLIQWLTTAAGAVDLVFHTRFNIGTASGLSRHMEHALDMAIAVTVL